MNKTSKIAIFSAFLTTGTVGVFALAGIAYAQEAQGFLPLTNVPGIFQQGKATDPIAVLRGLYGLAMGIGAVIAVVMIIYGGFEYMYQESVFSKSEAKSRIINAFAGLALILGSYVIFKTINNDLVNFNLALPGGSGKLTGLIASQAAHDAEVTQQLHAQVLDVTAARNEAATAKTAYEKASKEVDTLKADYAKKCGAGTLVQKETCATLKEILDAKEIAANTAATIYTQKTVTASLKESRALTGIALDDRMSKKVLNELSGGGTGGKDSPEQIFSEYSKEDLATKIESIKKNISDIESLSISEESKKQALDETKQLLAKIETSKAFYDKVATIDIYATKSRTTVASTKINSAAQQLSDLYEETIKGAGNNEVIKAQIQKDYDNSLNALRLYVNGPQGNKPCDKTENQGSILCKN